MPNAFVRPVREIEAENAWSSLWAGEWTVVDHLEGPSHTIICDPVRSRPVTPLLSPDEIQVAVARARGIGLKAVAADSGRSMTTVSNLLARVRRKLILRGDAQLVFLFGGADREDVVPTPAGLQALVEGYGPDERLFLYYRCPSWRLPPTLSVAERTVALDLLDGASRRDIAFSRGTSPRTVANQMASIFRKLRVSSRVELLAALRSRQGQDAP
jgi:DNA-binding CsgD family transcriptional regulator